MRLQDLISIEATESVGWIEVQNPAVPAKEHDQELESSSTKPIPVQVNTVPDSDGVETRRLDYACSRNWGLCGISCGVNHVEPVVSDIRLDACTYVQYEERNDVQGVKFTTDDRKEGWTPIETYKVLRRRSIGNGSTISATQSPLGERNFLRSNRWYNRTSI